MSEFSGITASTSNVPLFLRDVLEFSRRVMQGKLNNTTLWTLAANTSSTTFNDARIGLETALHWSPTTANAAAIIDTMYVSESNRVNGTVIIAHANNSNADKIFRITFHG
tara:strand:- start:6586 stop:6915 length:330 start_codon:yes stop_codon:yes gene_type:complete